MDTGCKSRAVYATATTRSPTGFRTDALWLDGRVWVENVSLTHKSGPALLS